MPALLTIASSRPNCLERGVDDVGGGAFIGDRGKTGDGLAAGGVDLLGDRFGGRPRVTAAVDVGAAIDDDDACSLGGQQQCVASSDPPARAGDHDHPVIEAQSGHDPLLSAIVRFEATAPTWQTGPPQAIRGSAAVSGAAAARRASSRRPVVEPTATS